jgi:ABC-type glutathione transport system ATPase component
MALLAVRKVSVSFEARDGKVCAVNDVSFSLEAGKVLALLGASGSGKSVTLRAILFQPVAPGHAARCHLIA